MTLDVWSKGSSMAATRPMVTTRLDAGFKFEFSLRQLYPRIAAGDLYSLQLRAYMPFANKHLRVHHSKGQAIVHVAHTLLCTSSADGSSGANATAKITRGTTLLPVGLGEEDLYHLHIAITCVSVPC